MKIKFNNFSFIICALLGCAGTYITLGQTGIFKFFMLAPVAALIIARLKDTSNVLKFALFASFSLIFAFVFLDGDRRIWAFASMIAVIVLALAFEWLLGKSKDKKILLLPAVICAVGTFAVTAIVLGEPITALSVKADLDGYIGEKYADGEYIVEDYGYDGVRYGYTVTAKNDRTASGIRIYKSRNGYIVDEYETHLKKSLMRPTSEAITTVLRENHPNDGFTVYGKDLQGVVTPLSVYDESDYSEGMEFYIYITNEMLPSKFAVLTREYFEEILDSGIKFKSITFIGGEKGRKIYELTAKYGYACNEFEELFEKHDYVGFSLKHIDFK